MTTLTPSPTAKNSISTVVNGTNATAASQSSGGILPEEIAGLPILPFLIGSVVLAIVAVILVVGTIAVCRVLLRDDL